MHYNQRANQAQKVSTDKRHTMATRTGKKSFVNPSYELGMVEDGRQHLLVDDSEEEKKRSDTRAIIGIICFIGLAALVYATTVQPVVPYSRPTAQPWSWTRRGTASAATRTATSARPASEPHAFLTQGKEGWIETDRALEAQETLRLTLGCAETQRLRRHKLK